MNLIRRPVPIILMTLIGLSLLYWLLPISGKIAYVPDEPTTSNTWPTITIEQSMARQMEVMVIDPTPWTYVRLEAPPTTATLTELGTQNALGQWVWRWHIEGEPTALTLYHSCDQGCQQWATVQISTVTPTANPQPLIPTKLGIVLASPQRNWHNRQGWDVEITYAQLAETEYWGIHDLAQRVQHANHSGLRVLVRVEWAQGQSLPPPNDYAALTDYLTYLQRLARDERLSDVYGFIIGSNFNTLGANSQAPENPVTPDWYARVFNGYGADPSLTNNALAVIRQENNRVCVLVGPVNVWNSDQDGSLPYDIDAPWLNYMNTLVAHLNTAVSDQLAQGISDGAPDGFAVQAFGRVDDPSLRPEERALEPLRDLHRDEWGEAQMGFRVYQDWLHIINQYPHLAGKPIYIGASNTFVEGDGRFPTENYPPGWLSNALTTINQEPQIQMLAWFLDDFPHDERWQPFSLTKPQGLLEEASQEFEALLQANTP